MLNTTYFLSTFAAHVQQNCQLELHVSVTIERGQ